MSRVQTPARRTRHALLVSDIDREVVRRGGLEAFARLAWPYVDPAPLVWSWHLSELCTHLEAVSRGEIQRLVINVPPGTGKSIFCNVLWPAWEWISRPQTKFLYASYDTTLVGVRDGGRVIKLLQELWFIERWGALLERVAPATHLFENRHGGFRFATSPGGKGTGRHGDIRVIDDPIKPKDASGGGSLTRRQLAAVSEWCAHTWASRATSQATVRDVLIMQRLHADDLAGEWLLRGDAVHLCLPMLFDPEIRCTTAWGGDRRSVEGEPLFPERFPAEVVERMRVRDMGPAVFAAQCQQRPQVKGGGLFRREWWRFWHLDAGVPTPCLCPLCWSAKRTQPGHEQPPCEQRIANAGQLLQSWDLTFKRTDTSDFVCGLVMQIYDRKAFVVDLVNERLSFLETLRELRIMSARYPTAYTKLIEDKANGAAVEDTLRQELSGIELVEPAGGKEARANAASIYPATQRLFLPHPALAPWVWAFVAQHEAFPRGAHDDIVDATSQALIWLRRGETNLAEAMARVRAR